MTERGHRHPRSGSNRRRLAAVSIIAISGAMNAPSFVAGRLINLDDGIKAPVTVHLALVAPELIGINSFR
jgi:hypothetical protein